MFLLKNDINRSRRARKIDIYSTFHWVLCVPLHFIQDNVIRSELKRRAECFIVK